MNKRRLQEETLAAFLIENKERLYRLAFSYVKNRDDALDVVQQSIYKALSARAVLVRPESLRSWVFRIVVTTAYDLLRQKRRLQPVGDEILDLHEPVGEDVPADFDLQRVLDSMDPKYKSVIVLRYFEDLKIEEVAEVLQENVNTVKTRLYKALAMLRLQKDELALTEEERS